MRASFSRKIKIIKIRLNFVIIEKFVKNSFIKKQFNFALKVE